MKVNIVFFLPSWIHLVWLWTFTWTTNTRCLYNRFYTWSTISTSTSSRIITAHIRTISTCLWHDYRSNTNTSYSIAFNCSYNSIIDKYSSITTDINTIDSFSYATILCWNFSHTSNDIQLMNTNRFLSYAYLFRLFINLFIELFVGFSIFYLTYIQFFSFSYLHQKKNHVWMCTVWSSFVVV